MKITPDKVIKAISLLSALGAFATIGIRLYSAAQHTARHRLADRRLDDALAQSMDCSDATASY